MNTFKKLLITLLVILSFAIVACDDPMSDYDECYYDLDSSTGIDSIRVLYPCKAETDTEVYNVTTLSGGFTNTKEDMYWLGTHLAEKGLIVFTVSASNNSSVSGYESAHLEAYDVILSENSDPSSVLYGKLGKIGLMGYSMGGGGVLNAGNSLSSAIDTVVAIAPYNPDNDLSGVDVPALIIVGEDDTVANPSSNAEQAYYALPDDITKILAEMSDFGHLEWVNNTSAEGDYPKEMIFSWLDYIYTGDSLSYDYLLDPPDKFIIYETNNL